MNIVILHKGKTLILLSNEPIPSVGHYITIQEGDVITQYIVKTVEWKFNFIPKPGGGTTIDRYVAVYVDYFG